MSDEYESPLFRPEGPEAADDEEHWTPMPEPPASDPGEGIEEDPASGENEPEGTDGNPTEVAGVAEAREAATAVEAPAEAGPAVDPVSMPDEDADDPFGAWPQPESQVVVEDRDETVSVEHVRGEIDVPDGYTILEGAPTGHRRSVAVVVSRFNGSLTNRMLARAIEALEDAGVATAAVTVVPVPGAFELPL